MVVFDTPTACWVILQILTLFQILPLDGGDETLSPREVKRAQYKEFALAAVFHFKLKVFRQEASSVLF